MRLTAVTAITGLFMLAHGWFGLLHVLSIATLVVLLITYVLERIANITGPLRYVIVLGYSLTLLFHYVPIVSEVGSRLPPRHPVFTGPDDPKLPICYGAGVLFYLIGAALQIRRVRRSQIF